MISFTTEDGYKFYLALDGKVVDSTCRDYVESVIEDQAKGIALDYAIAFLSDVNWHEIAQHYIPEEESEES